MHEQERDPIGRLDACAGERTENDRREGNDQSQAEPNGVAAA
jgi:hypothetical protein